MLPAEMPSGNTDVLSRQILTGMFGESSPGSPEVGSLSFVGGIVFDRGRSVLAIASHEGRLLTETRSVEDVGPGWMSALSDSKRVLTLKTFSEVEVRQVDLPKVEFLRPPTLRSTPSLFLQLNVLNPTTEEAEIHRFEEDQIFDVFTGDKESGGLVAFSGIGLPEEIGILFHSVGPQGRQARIFFIHPDEPGNEFSSIVGLTHLVGELNRQFTEDISPADGTNSKVLEAWEKTKQKGRINFSKAPYRESIYLLQILLHEKRLQATGDSEHKYNLKTRIPELRRGLGRIYKRWGNHQRHADDKVDRTIIDDSQTLPVEEKGRKTIEREEFIADVESRLITDRAQKLWRNTMDSYYQQYDSVGYSGSKANKVILSCLDNITSMIGGGRTAEQFDDAVELLEGLFQTDFRTTEVSYILTSQADGRMELRYLTDNRDAGYYEHRRSALVLKTDLIAQALRRKERL